MTIEAFIAMYGKLLLSITGTVVAVVMSAFGVLLSIVYRQHNSRVDHIETMIIHLNNAVTEMDSNHSSDLSGVMTSVQELRSELHLSKQAVEHMKAGIMSLDGSLKNQQITMHEHIKELTRTNAGLEAVFRFIDAPKRPTDAAAK